MEIGFLWIEILDKSPLRYVLASSLSFPGPRKMFSANEFVKRLKQCMRVLLQVGYLKKGETYNIKRQ